MSNDIDDAIEALKAFKPFELPDDTEHRGGVPWHDAPVPPRWHRCTVQTSGWVGLFDQVQRCACGSIRNPGISRRWMEKNSRRKK